MTASIELRKRVGRIANLAELIKESADRGHARAFRTPAGRRTAA